jgi:hypothetical protein
MSLRKFMFGLIGGLLLCSVVTVEVSARTKTIRVDCSRGKSIKRALAYSWWIDELTIEIDGICDEDVLVKRDGVTLLGINLDEDGEPEDGIRAVSTDAGPPNFGATLFIRDALNVTVENLILTGGELGLRVVDSGNTGTALILVKNCRLENNTLAGLSLGRANVVFEDTVIIGGSRSATLIGMSTFSCEKCSIEGALRGGDSTFSLIGSTLKGRFQVARSRIDLTDTVQTENPTFNALFHDSQLNVRGVSTILGLTRFTAFSTGVFFSDTHTGDLMCLSGGDAVCPGATINGTSNCPQCLVP